MSQQPAEVDADESVATSEEEVPLPEGTLYRPAPGENQLTARALLAGALLGGFIAAMNVYFGLQTGWAIGGSIIAAILSYSLFSVVQRTTGAAPFTRLETNIAQTTASAAGTMTTAAGLSGALPAMAMLGNRFSWVELLAWAASVAWLGVFYAVPLRRQMILTERLRFPSGTATAETIVAMYSEGEDARRKARWLLRCVAIGAVFTLAAFFLPVLGRPPLHEWFPVAALTVPAAFGFIVLVSPLMLGAGILIGPRVGASLLLGALVSWGMLAPFVQSQGWVQGPVNDYAAGAAGWILWPGVAIMVSDALTQLAMSWRSVLGTFRRVRPASGSVDTSSERIPDSWWMGGLLLTSLFTMVSARVVFDIPMWMTALAIAMSSVLATIAVRSTGETDINPIGGMGKVTQLVFGGVAPGQVTTNLMTAGITAAGAAQAADMMQDLKTGWMLGASPRKQFVAQLLGAGVGIFVCVPIYVLFDSVYTIGTEKLPAPAAHAWKGMAELLSSGFEATPTHADTAVLLGLLFGSGMALARVFAPPSIGRWMPSGLAVGIAFVVPAYYSVAMFVGSMAYVAWRALDRPSAEALGFAVASGLVAGEGLMGVVTALLQLFGVQGG